MKTFYWVNTRKFCAGITVDENDKVYGPETAPCYKWMSGKKFTEMMKWMRNKRYLISCKKLNE